MLVTLMLLLAVTQQKLIYISELSTPSSPIIPSVKLPWVKYPWTAGGYGPSGARAAHVAGEDLRWRYRELFGDPSKPLSKGQVNYSACRDKRCYLETTIKNLALMRLPKDTAALPFSNSDARLLPGTMKEFGFSLSTIDFNTSLHGGFAMYQHSDSNSIFDNGLDLRLCK